ncbi:MAG: DUF805 domain-containing protein [Fibromonadaceae bacterium]|jgi:uncharacterized membrane protein YhaH (DUF805 family)|nr:DUF805 domain-containing protein [Fibromonadaceae bacterium]
MEQSNEYVNMYVGVLKKWKDFSGRASRREFWVFTLLNAIICFTIGMILTALDGIFYTYAGTIISVLFSLVVMVLGLAVTVRRLHDTDRSSWWILILFVPLIGYVAWLASAVSKGTEGDNRYGPDPRTQYPTS